MSPRRRLGRRVIKTYLPIILVIVLAFVGAMVVLVWPYWPTYGITRPPRAPYLVTPQTFTLVGGQIPKATDVTWTNHDGTKARGWLILGADGSPAVILLHRYGTDRSLLLNLAVKLNETTNFTVLVPDLRGHGENPPVNWTLFGSIEGDDTTAAIEYLHTLRATGGKPQISHRIGLYGIELGAYSALDAASHSTEVRALVLDSAPASPDDLVRAGVVAMHGVVEGQIHEAPERHRPAGADLGRQQLAQRLVLGVRPELVRGHAAPRVHHDPS